jgi:DNA-nicking Smr family endonuclease
VSRRQDDHQRFAHSPFKSLKGLPVSGAGPPSPPSPPPAVAEPPLATQDDETELFSREMTWLAVRPLPGAAPVATPAAATGAGEALAPVAEAADAEFLAAIGQLDKAFKDELPPPEATRTAQPRRLKQLARGGVQPAGELDLHGLTRDEALNRTRAFLGHAARQGWPVVLIVTGKGLHSSDGPVLRRAVERLLDDARDLVLEWGVAPRRYGGAGALVVFVRGARPGQGG